MPGGKTMMRAPFPLPEGEQSYFRVTTGCKINFFLRIKEKRPDGYHDLESLFLPLSDPSDTLQITLLPPHICQGGLQVSCDTPGIDPENNTLTKTYARYAAATGFAPNLRVRLTKGVPHGAGLGGGSANSAAFLQFLQKQAAGLGYTPLDAAALTALGASIGADVPFFLLNQPALVQGIGERLTLAENPCAGVYLVLVCPELVISTSWAFARLDEARAKNRETGPSCLTGMALPDSLPTSHGVFPENDFEEVVFPAFPQLFHIQRELRSKGASSAHLSGTGSSLFGLFKDEQTAGKAAEELRRQGLRVYTHSWAPQP